YWMTSAGCRKLADAQRPNRAGGGIIRVPTRGACPHMLRAAQPTATIPAERGTRQSGVRLRRDQQHALWVTLHRVGWVHTGLALRFRIRTNVYALGLFQDRCDHLGWAALPVVGLVAHEREILDPDLAREEAGGGQVPEEREERDPGRVRRGVFFFLLQRHHGRRPHRPRLCRRGRRRRLLLGVADAGGSDLRRRLALPDVRPVARLVLRRIGDELEHLASLVDGAVDGRLLEALAALVVEPHQTPPEPRLDPTPPVRGVLVDVLHGARIGGAARALVPGNDH